MPCTFYACKILHWISVQCKFLLCTDLEGDSDGSDTEPVTTPVSVNSPLYAVCIQNMHV